MKAKQNKMKLQLLEGLENRQLMANFAVTSNANSGNNTLRWAIDQANTSAGADTIAFNLSSGSRTITVTSALPAITGPTTIDGSTNPGYIGVPVVEITGNNLIVANALTINADNSTVRGLSVTGFARDANFNFGRGIVLNGSNNVVENNYLSLRLNGSQTLALARYAIELNGANNVIRNNAGYGGLAFVGNDFTAPNANNNVITGNYIGTSASGINLASGSGINYGISLSAGSGNRIGGPADADRNIIAIPAFAGVYVNFNAGATTIQNNFIGVNVGGSAALTFNTPGTNGVHISSGSGHVLRDNVIANAPANQIEVTTGSNIQIHGNKIGLTYAGAPSGVGQRGIRLAGDDTNLVTLGSANAADRNWIMPGALAGLDADNSGNITVTNNVFGLAPNGTATALHSTPGIRANAVAGNLHVENNILASTGQVTLIYATDLSSNGTIGGNVRFVGNQLGMNLAGTSAVAAANSSAGINISGTANALVANNKIAGVSTGIVNEGLNYIRGNQIGLDASGLNPLSVGTGISSIFGTVGGSNPGEGNLIGDWNSFAIQTNDGGDAVIRGNRIGTNLDGTGIYTGTAGIASSVSVTIGGTNPGEGNVITGASFAIDLSGGAHIIQGNTLGLPGRANGTGIRIAVNGNDVSNTLIGGDTNGAGNVIAHNNGKAIVLQQTSGSFIGNVTIRRNSIHSNSNMAIDLGNDGVTANDALDVDTGANALQNFPLIFSADSTSGSQTAVSGFINSSASTPIIIDFYSADASSNEARTWLGSKTIITDVAGGASFTHNLPFVSGNKYIVATATNIAAFPNGSTSELSPGSLVSGPADNVAPTVSSSIFEFESAQKVQLVFSEEMNASSIAANDLTMNNTTTGQNFVPSSVSYDAATRTARFSFASILPDGNYAYALATGKVTDVAGNGNVVANGTTHVLACDVNRDKAVNFDDLLTLAQNYGTSGKTFGQGDSNYDGNVNFDDLLLLAQRYGTSLFSTAPITPATAKPRAGNRAILA